MEFLNHQRTAFLLLALLLIIPYTYSNTTIKTSVNHKKIDNDLSQETNDESSLSSSVSVENTEEAFIEEESLGPRPCTCGIFLSKQFKRGSKHQPKGEPVITQEMDTHFAHNSIGARQCVNKCIEMIIKHLAKSADIICATIDHDCVREKAYLFTRNYDDQWSNTNMSAGREFCCKDNLPYTCPK